MKKIYSFLFAAVTVFAAASCQKEVDNNVQATPAEDTFTVTATVGLDTKTTLDENGKSTLWTTGDKISVFDMNPAGNNCCFEIATEDLPAATAEFKYTGEFIRPDVNENPDPFLVALYPYQSTALCDFANTYMITGISVPTEQVAKADGFDSAATFALAIGTESTKNDLKFNNLYSLLKFTVADEGVKSVTVAVNSEAKLAGEATVQLAVGQTGITGGALAATGSSSVTLECEEGFTVGETYYIAVAPVSYTSLTVSLDETVVKTVSTAKTLNANTIYNLGNLAAPAKSERNLQFASATFAAEIGGNPFVAPALSGEASGVEYSSSNPSVATVDNSTGAVNLVDEGQTIIRAYAPENETHLSGEATYTLNVTYKMVRIYVTVYPHYHAWDNWKTTPKIHYWGDYGETTWPGVELIRNTEGTNNQSDFYYEFKYSNTKKTQFLINNGTGAEKSADSISLTMDKDYYYSVWTDWKDGTLVLNKDK